METKKYNNPLLQKATTIVILVILFFGCNTDEISENNNMKPSWSEMPQVEIREGEAGSYTFPELSKGNAECACNLVSGNLPEWASLSSDCVLSWTRKAKPEANAIFLIIEAKNGAGTENSEVFELKFSTTSSNSSIVFQETFDNQPDWFQQDRCLYDNFSAACNTIPSGWNYFYVDDKNPTHAAGYIEAAAARGGSGKGYHLWDESRGANSRWKSEAQLGKRLPQAYQELWFSFWIRFNPNAQWEGGDEDSKVFRAGAFNPLVMDGTTGTSVFNVRNSNEKNNGLGRTTGGLFIMNVVHHDAKPTRIRLSTRCNATYKCGTYDEVWDYLVNPGAPTNVSDWSTNFGDGNWHKLEVHMVMNSSPGVGDGVLEVYYDGTRLGGRTNVPWKMDNAESWIEGINYFAIAGNSENEWAGNIDTPSSPEQSFYFMDDIQVCTTRCP